MGQAKENKNRLWVLIHSIRFRLALWFVLILAVVIFIFSFFIYTRQVQELRTLAAARLELKARRLVGPTRPQERDDFERSFAQIQADSAGGGSLFQESDVLVLFSADGEIIQSWGINDEKTLSNYIVETLAKNKDRPNQDPAHPLAGNILVTQLPGANSGGEYVFTIGSISMGGRSAGYYLFGNPVDPDHQLPRLLVSLLIGISITLLIALLGGFWLADRAIRPVKKITQAAQSISETDLSLRLNLHQNDELGELADTFDAMLGRLEGAFQRQRQFTADASHELRTPLTIVELEATRALAAPRSSLEYNRALKVIRSENQFMSRLVNNLLTLARMDNQQLILQKQAIDLSDVVLEVVERLAPLAKKEAVRLSAGDLPELPIHGDRQFLAQMVTNLVENGIKYSGGGDRVVEVTTGEVAGEQIDQKMAWVRVTDHGAGIPPEHLAHLFDRFYQVDKVRTQQAHDGNARSEQSSSGAGLGLSIALWIARAHGGDIRVESEVGKGSIFYVILPLSKPPKVFL